jgi:hypothetical protein
MNNTKTNIINQDLPPTPAAPFGQRKVKGRQIYEYDKLQTYHHFKPLNSRDSIEKVNDTGKGPSLKKISGLDIGLQEANTDSGPKPSQTPPSSNYTN